jgi:hypothetical protein
VHGVFPSSLKYFASSQKCQFHWVNIGDSGEVVTPFMQVGTYPTRNFATLGPSKLQPPFAANYSDRFHDPLFYIQHRAGVRLYTSFYNLAESCVFSKQSPLPILWHFLKKHSFSRSYGVNLPSSFNIVISTS